MGVPEIKVPHQWCKHARPGTGCAIYQDRPKPCRVFECRWLVDDSLPDYWYPARSKILIDIQRDDEAHGEQFVMCFVVDASYPLRWREEPYFSDIKTWAREGIERHGWVTVVMVKDDKIPILD